MSRSLAIAAAGRLRVRTVAVAGFLVLSLPSVRATAARTSEILPARNTHGSAARVPTPEWRIVGDGPASPGGVFCPQIRVAPDGVPHLAYQDFNAPSHRLGARRFANGAWIPLTTAGSGSTGDAWYNRLAFAADGTLLVASRDYGLGGAVGVRACAGPGAPWLTLGGGPASVGEAHYTDVVVHPDGRIFAAYQDRTTVPPDRMTVVVSSGGEWRSISGAGVSANLAGYESLALRPDGSLLAGFTDAAVSGKASVYAWSGIGDTWQPLGQPGFTPDLPTNLVLRVAPDGTPHVAYYVWNTRIVVRRYDGTAWPALGPGVDGIDVPTVETEGWRQWLGFEIDSVGRPVVAYQAANLGRRAVVKRWDPGTGEWSVLGVEGFTPGAADYLALALAPDGTPYVALRDGTTGRALVMSFR